MLLRKHLLSALWLCVLEDALGARAPAPGNQQLTLSQSCLAPRFFLDQRLVILWGIIHSAHTKQLELELPEGRGRSCPLLHPSIQPWVQCMLAEVTQAGTYTLSSALYHLLNLLRPYYEKLWEEPGKTTPSYRRGNGDAESLNHLFPFLCAFVSAVPLGLKTLPSSFRSQCSCHPPSPNSSPPHSQFGVWVCSCVWKKAETQHTKGTLTFAFHKATQALADTQLLCSWLASLGSGSLLLIGSPGLQSMCLWWIKNGEMN